MFKQTVVIIAFFVAYAWAAFRFMSWLARVRVAAVDAPERFSPLTRVFSFGVMFVMGVLPPVLEILCRVFLNSKLNDGQFYVFVFVWIASLMPGCMASRRILRAGGIDPDA